jgi:glycerol-3-phosphate acyltransferase PlsY
MQFLIFSFSFFGPPKWVDVLPWTALAILVIWKHRENIKRLQEGTESKLWGAKKEATHVQG